MRVHSLALARLLGASPGSFGCCVDGIEFIELLELEGGALQPRVVGRRLSGCMPWGIRVRMNFDEELRRSADLL